MGRCHTIPGQPHPSHPAQKGEIMRRSAEPKHLKETEKPKAPKNILAAATVAASAGALIMTATPALAEESASETAPAKDTAQTETAATTTESAKQTLDEATAAHDKAAQMPPPRSRTSRTPKPRRTRTRPPCATASRTSRTDLPSRLRKPRTRLMRQRIPPSRPRAPKPTPRRPQTMLQQRPMRPRRQQARLAR